MERLELSFFGFPTIQRNHANVTLTDRKALALLAYLAVSGTTHGRDALATLFWPDHNQQRARANLRYVLWLIRQQVGKELLVVDRESVCLAQGDTGTSDTVTSGAVTSDVARFWALCHEGERAAAHVPDQNGAEPMAALADAVALYQGDFLAGFSLEGSSDFDDWQRAEAEHLRRQVATVLERLVDFHCEAGEVAKAITFARRWLALDPLHEAVQRRLMTLYQAAGEDAAALRQYAECVRLLETELNVSPAAETTALYERIRTRQQPHATAHVTAHVTVAQHDPVAATSYLPQRTPTTHNLPRQPTRFVGRAGELEQLAARLGDPACRLVTIVGAGGVGKTRLALHAAEAQIGHFAHGVYFVALSGVDKAELVAATILDALAASRLGSVASGEFLLDYLRDKELLLLLDNFEHLDEATALLIDVLRAAPKVKLLVTSRERLHLREEWLLPLLGLHTPSVDEANVAPTAWEHFEALQFFAECARRVDPDFAFASDAAAHVEICRLVDGVPLAIELAAAWLRVLTAGEIAAEIRQRLDFLTTTLRDTPARHRSMRAVFEHSWQLLPEDERLTLGQLSVFRGGFTRAAAETVAGATLAQLSALLDKSWLHALPHQRYRMHELVRQFCADQLEASARESAPGLVEAVRDRHSAYFATFVQAQETKLTGRKQGEAIAAILAEMDNIWAAWYFAADHLPQRAYILRLGQFGEGFSFIVRVCGLFQEVHGALTLALKRLHTLPLTGEAMIVRARLLLYHGWLCIDPGLLDEAFAHCEAARALLRNEEPSRAQTEALGLATMSLGWAHYNAGNYEEAAPLCHEALRCFEVADVSWPRGMTRMYLALIAFRMGDIAEAEAWSKASMLDCEALGYLALISSNLRIVAQIAMVNGDYARAQMLLTKGLQCAVESGIRKHVGHTLLLFGAVATAQADYAAAHSYYEQGFALAREIGDRLAEASLRNGMAATALAEGDLAEANALFTTNLAMCEEIGRRRDALLAHEGLGNVALAQGDYAVARGHFRQALHMALALRATPDALQVLVAMAQVLVAVGNAEHAARLLHCVVQHEAATAQSRTAAADALATLEAVHQDNSQDAPNRDLAHDLTFKDAPPSLAQLVAELQLALP